MTSTPQAPVPLREAYARALDFHRRGNLLEAERWCKAILARKSDHFDSLHMVGIIAAQGRRYDEALQWLDRALAVDASSAKAHGNKSAVLRALGRFDEALASCDRALAIDPSFADAHRNRAAILKELGRRADALASCDAALALRPEFAEVLNIRGSLFQEQGRPAEALADYDRVLAIAPDFPEAWSNRAGVLETLQRFDEAVASCNRALAIKPDLADAFYHRGLARSFLGRYAEAAHDLQRAMELDARIPHVDGALLQVRLQCCDWRDLGAQRQRVTAGVRSAAPTVDPATFLVVSGSAADQLACARTWMRRYPRGATAAATGGLRADGRIRVAYLSADLHEHATAYLAAELFELHDRSRFEITAVSWGPDADGAMRRRLKAAFEHFEDVRSRSDADVATLLRERGIDIAVDLKGLTYDARPEIFAARPAPVQVNFLGYPGTLGAEWIDYVVADATVIPHADRVHYAERVAYLPDCYQPNDRRRPVAAATPTRAECGLPEQGFVFCCFNNNYKILPEVFDVWMRLLTQVEGSLLWLLSSNAAAPENLRREAQARGVAPDRLVFAQRVPLPEHLARHRVADLFLDTLPYNAHTTTSDALWAGLPVLTCLGTTFAGRVAASLLRAAGLPELVTASLADYEAMALELAADAAALGKIKARLVRERDACALFDTARFARHLESAYATMWERHRRGEPPASFAVQ